MKRYLVYDAGGTILRTGWCQDDMVQAQAAPGEFAMEGKAVDSINRVLDGQILTLEEFEAAIAERGKK